MKTQNSTAVVIAAGGLGTRVAGWSTFMPKEFRPVEGRPGIVHVLQEAEAGGAQRAVVVHHPYYIGLADWASQVFGPGGTARYRQLAKQAAGQQQPLGLRVNFVPQRGRYADVTSALNGSEYLRTGTIGLVFSDNVDTTHQAMAELVAATDPAMPAVLTSPSTSTAPPATVSSSAPAPAPCAPWQVSWRSRSSSPPRAWWPSTASTTSDCSRAECESPHRCFTTWPQPSGTPGGWSRSCRWAWPPMPGTTGCRWSPVRQQWSTSGPPTESRQRHRDEGGGAATGVATADLVGNGGQTPEGARAPGAGTGTEASARTTPEEGEAGGGAPRPPHPRHPGPAHRRTASHSLALPIPRPAPAVPRPPRAPIPLYHRPWHRPPWNETRTP